MSRIKDLTGERYGRLVVKKYVGNSSDRHALWLCECDCGGKAIAASNSLKKGGVVSCGCARAEHLKEFYDDIESRKMHEHVDDRLFRVWQGMNERCSNKRHKSYKNYGGRGIKICDDWKDFCAFRDWAYAAGYDKDAPYGYCTIDRIDVNGNYEPLNCRWADAKTQASNRRKIVRITIEVE